MYRKQHDALRSWLNRKNRKPLIIRGARQVGKSTLVDLFAKQEKRGILNVNLERHPELASAFESNDPNAIIQEIEYLENMPNSGPNTFLFLDEIQAIPKAIPALRYFYEERKDIAVIAAGSLLEFTLADHTFSMPVGRVQYLHMGPMTFTEFLIALGEEKLSEFILNYSWGQKIGEVVHQRLLKLLRSYYFVGGMPEAVSVYAETKSYKEVEHVHRSILETYQDDFPKYAKAKRFNRMLHVFNFTAKNVGKKVKYSTISPNEQSSQVKRDVNLLCQAKILNKVIHSSCSGVPLQAEMNDRIFKLLFLDVGLMNSLCGLNWRVLKNEEDKKLINDGVIAEQFIGQHLQDYLNMKPNNTLNYWLREGKSSNAELDYVVEINGETIPIEVKSGASGKLRSMHQFMGGRDIKRGFRFDSSRPSIVKVETKISTKIEEKNVSYDLISLPLYLVERLESIVSET